ncbi:hypothetical protein [Mucilaginibacter antarcticus]|uniref:hypothetical protein n=1 Tax=Mucilaginibacter antarcticus TaxID=1855725 RepID=UPI003638C731
MKNLIALFVFITTSTTVYGQQFNQNNNVPDYLKKIDTPRVYHTTTKLPPVPRFTKDKLNNDTSGFVKSPLMMLKLKPSGKLVKSFPSLGFIKQEDIASMEILKDKPADSLYGVKAKYGVIILELVSTVKTYTIPQFLTHFSIGKQDQRLPIYMDFNLLGNMAGMLITEGDTKSVTVEKTTPVKNTLIS